MARKSVTKSSGNLFADIGVNNPEEALVKAKLVRGKLSGFSIDRLFRFLTLLGSDIEIVVKDSPGSKAGHMKVAVA